MGALWVSWRRRGVQEALHALPASERLNCILRRATWPPSAAPPTVREPAANAGSTLFSGCRWPAGALSLPLQLPAPSSHKLRLLSLSPPAALGFGALHVVRNLADSRYKQVGPLCLCIAPAAVTPCSRLLLRLWLHCRCPWPTRTPPRWCALLPAEQAVVGGHGQVAGRAGLRHNGGEGMCMCSVACLPVPAAPPLWHLWRSSRCSAPTPRPPTPSHNNPQECLRRAKRLGYQVVATSLG